MTLILKIGPKHFEGLPFHPRAAEDWEGATITAPLPKDMAGNTVEASQLMPGEPVLIWTHHEQRRGEEPGQGLVAEAKVSSARSIGSGLMEIDLSDVSLPKPAINRDQMASIADESEAIRNLLSFTTTRSLLVHGVSATEFNAAVGNFRDRQLDQIREAAERYGLGSTTISREEAGSGAAWSLEELRACLLAYMEMLAKELNGEPFVKAEVNRRLRENGLSGRSEGSVEFRMQNISAFLASIGLPAIDGYKPRGNIGTRVRAELEAAFVQLPSQDVETYASSDSEEEVARRAEVLRKADDLPRPIGCTRPRRSSSVSTAYERSPEVVAFVLNRAHGHCELCRGAAPFENLKRVPFLEVHHVMPLSEGGPDVIENAAALCPNCHRACHHAWDREALAKRLIAGVDDIEAFQ